MSCVVVFGRQPVAGLVKTRLAATIGDRAAAAVYGELLEHTLRTAAESGLEVVLSLSDPATGGWSAKHVVRQEIQPSGDLGERLAGTFRRRFGEGHGRVVIVGSDCAAMGGHHLREAVDRLSNHPVVLGPAHDGGYWLVGQSTPGYDLFTGIPWSSPVTLAATRRRLGELGIGWTELDTLEDLDTEDALRRAVASRRVGTELADRLQAAWSETSGGPP
jgi:rSAM/selenodomain-associated transferase 1